MRRGLRRGLRRTLRRDALHIYLLLEGATALFFGLVFTVNMVYQVTVVELDPLQLVLVGTTLEAAVFLFEVPTGVVADAYSRRLSILIGLVLIGAGFALEGAVPHFVAVLGAQVLWGIGYTFTSGATQAWIADEVGEKRAGAAFLRGAQVGQIGGLLGLPISVGLGLINVQVPIVLAGVGFIALGAVLAFIMPETRFQPAKETERTTWGTMWDTLRAGLRLVRGRRVLLVLLGLSAITGLYSEGFDRLWTAHLIDTITLPGPDPVLWFGGIALVARLMTLGITELIRRELDTTNRRALIRLRLGLEAVQVVGVLVFALTGQLWLALAAYWIFAATRGASAPVETAWLNQHLTPEVRATVFSMTGQVNAVSQVVGGPVVGALGTATSIRVALFTSGLILSTALPLLAWALRLESTTKSA